MAREHENTMQLLGQTKILLEKGTRETTQIVRPIERITTKLDRSKEPSRPGNHRSQGPAGNFIIYIYIFNAKQLEQV